ncbi:MAG: HEPN domain-containing protein [Synechococcales bacterium]|nr:HEPN domain-containing protein [Synechococcales bacterium]
MRSVSQLLILAEQELETSQLLLEHERYRACISRAYYVMYYGTQALLSAKQIASRTHKGMIQQFSQHFVKSDIFSTDMAEKLSNNFDLRHLSDYEENAVIDRSQAEKALAASLEFIDRIRIYLEGNAEG